MYVYIICVYTCIRCVFIYIYRERDVHLFIQSFTSVLEGQAWARGSPRVPSETAWQLLMGAQRREVDGKHGVEGEQQVALAQDGERTEGHRTVRFGMAGRLNACWSALPQREGEMAAFPPRRCRRGELGGARGGAEGEAFPLETGQDQQKPTGPGAGMAPRQG